MRGTFGALLISWTIYCMFSAEDASGSEKFPYDPHESQVTKRSICITFANGWTGLVNAEFGTCGFFLHRRHDILCSGSSGSRWPESSHSVQQYALTIPTDMYFAQCSR
ncbi:hypothetical protein EDD36DRAFT_114628 [Exophiala viscosa]|uniref:Uncharacterized protein n=1 Tax=Exophiala viscosa TaxID=2486360 RepID=A0AAN6DMD5_9EURO|nr:hypothetical protein EDD36DRAFT_114628 [Exophiala viscosa]